MTTEIDATADDALWVVADRIRFLGGLEGHAPELIEAEIPPGSGTPPHSHASAEMFYVVSGELTVSKFSEVGAPPEIVKARAGTEVRIDPHVPHNYVNESGAPAKVVVLLEPSMIAFFREIGTEQPEAAPDFARIGAAMEKHGIAAMTEAA